MNTKTDTRELTKIKYPVNPKTGKANRKAVTPVFFTRSLADRSKYLPGCGGR